MDISKTSGDYHDWVGRDLYDPEGNKIGSITDIYADDASGRPEWLAVKTGWFGNNVSFVPIAGAMPRRGTDGDSQDLEVGFSKDDVKSAPNVDGVNGHLSAHDEQMLFKHYDFSWDDRDSQHFGYGQGYAKAQRFDTGYKTQNVESEMLNQTVQTNVPIEANVRLRRYQTQGTRTVTVPTTEEHVEVEGVDAKTQQQARSGKR